jgi:hypothetical protein
MMNSKTLKYINKKRKLQAHPFLNEKTRAGWGDAPQIGFGHRKVNFL